MDDRVDTTILELCAARGRDRSICPSEAARVLTPADEDWRRLMPRVRQRAVALAREGRIEILRKGKPVVNLAELRGVIRLRIAGDESRNPPDLSGGSVPHPSTDSG